MKKAITFFVSQCTISTDGPT